MAWHNMNQAEWLTSGDGLCMFMQNVSCSTRKTLLILAACLRWSEPWLWPRQRTPQVTVEDVECLAEGSASGFDPIKAIISYGMCNGEPGFVTVNVGPFRVEAGEFVPIPNQDALTLKGTCAEEIVAQVIRDVVGNPFIPRPRIDQRWLSWHQQTVRILANAAYNSRELPRGILDKVRLAVLSDALEEAGCTDVDILGHLRELGPHVSGCWALDLLLGKQ